LTGIKVGSTAISNPATHAILDTGTSQLVGPENDVNQVIQLIAAFTVT
jgi:hypothetical protein